MSEQTNVDLIRGIYEAFSRGDIAAVLGVIDPKAELSFEAPADIPWAGMRYGREGWAAFFQAIGENLDEMSVSMEPFAAQGDRVVSLGRYQGRVKRTGRRIDSPLVHLWTVRDGMVVRCVELTNSAAEKNACAN
jgi:ketosteroid isomerase-like protein